MKYAVLTFGCRTNQADSCRIERRMIDDGGVSSAPDTADVVVVNTCTVTAAADQAARHAVRRIARLNPQARILVTGCYAARRPDEIGRLPGVTLLPRPDDMQPEPPVASRAAPAVSLRPGNRGRTAYPLRVQTGCDEQCAYCIVPGTRGPGRSLPLALVLDVGDARPAVRDADAPLAHAALGLGDAHRQQVADVDDELPGVHRLRRI